MSYKNVILVVFSVFISSNAFSSGGYSGGSSGGFSGGSSISGGVQPRPAKQIDQAYEYGKSVYFGRLKGQVISYCIVNKEVSSPVKRSTIRQAKGVTYAELGERLHNCSQPKETMAQLLTSGQMNAVAYYLNKRYRLGLQRS